MGSHIFRLWGWARLWWRRLSGSPSVGGRWGLQGREGEQAASRHLKRMGYRLIGRNLRSRLGEIDLLAEAPDQKTMVLVEVKSARVSRSQGVRVAPEARVGRSKQRRLAALASQLARRYGFVGRPIRFDVIGVDLPGHAGRGKAVVRHHVGAFESHV